MVRSIAGTAEPITRHKLAARSSPHSGHLIIRPPVTELTADNTDQVVHSVDANRSAEQRISVSFNLMFPTYTEVMSKPMW